MPSDVIRFTPGRIRAIIQPEGGLLLDTKTDLLFRITHTGAIIWSKLEKGHGIDDIAQTLVNTFRIDHELALSDVTGFITIIKGFVLSDELPMPLSHPALHYSGAIRVLNPCPSPEAQGRLADWRIQRLKKALTANPSCPSLKTLSVTIGLSAGHLARRFKRTMGLGFRPYVLRLKVQSALNLLRSSDLSVKEIADRLGYQHASDFCHHFKQVTDLTPSTFRQFVKMLDQDEQKRCC